MLNDLISIQFTEELKCFILNKEQDVENFNLCEFIDYCSKNKLVKENYQFIENVIDFKSILLNFFMLEISSGDTELFKSNKKFLKDIILSNNLFNIENVKNNFNIEKNNKQKEVLEEINDINDPKERKKEMMYLLSDSIFDQSSLTYQLYSNPINYIENILPNLRNHFNKYYNVLKESVDKTGNILDREITREQIDILISKEISNIIKFCCSYNFN